MNVQELCDKLVQRRLAELQVVLFGSGPIQTDDFPTALTPEWLGENIDEIFNLMSRPDSMKDEQVGALEINAFLAAFQRAYEAQSRPRIQRWADSWSFRNRSVFQNGALMKRLRNIGVAVDDEFLTREETPTA